MKTVGESFFEEHEGACIVHTPSSQVPQVLKAGDIVVQEPWLHAQLQELLVSVLCLRGVSECRLEVPQEHFPKGLMRWENSLL